ncbi:MAG: hypothetical protein V5A59_04190 [Bacteroidales bacterium]|nr:hypothetical protein [Bacteroidales bacterium]MBS3775374.1 hypothetical protein [Bacteroidales bacterium]
MMFIKLLLPAILIVAIALIFLGIRMLIQKNGKFPETEIGRNKEMRKLGINCARVEEIKCRREIDQNGGCGSCGLF